MIDGLVPADQAVQGTIWWALQGSMLLAGMPAPTVDFDFANAHSSGLTHVVSLIGDTDLDSRPLTKVSYELEDLWDRPGPTDPVAERAHVATASSAVLELLDAGHGVVVHCLGGTGRTGTVIGAVLCSFAADPAEVVGWLDAVHKQRGQSGWPESPWQRSALDVLTSNQDGSADNSPG